MELIVVIAIIGILTSIGFASYDNVRKKGRDARRKQDLNALKSALVLYYQDFKKYPPACSSCADEQLSSGSSANWIPGLNPYMANLPKDPIQSPGNCTTVPYQKYCYTTTSDRDSFVIFAMLENTNDPGIRTKPTAICWRNPNLYWLGAAPYNYCVESPAL